MKLPVRILPFSLGIAGLLSLALLIYPWSLSTQTSSFSLSPDLDRSEGDQAVSSLDVSPDQVVPIQIFGSDIQDASSLSIRFEYDSTQVVYEGFDAGDVTADQLAAIYVLRLPYQGILTLKAGVFSGLPFSPDHVGLFSLLTQIVLGKKLVRGRLNCVISTRGHG